MSGKPKTVPSSWKQVLDAETISRCISRISYEIVEKDRDVSNLAIVGIRTGGEFIAKRLQQRIEEIEKAKIAFGVIDITLYRDDLSHQSAQPTLRGTDLPFSISGTRIVLVDDVLYTGRTIRAALDAIIDFGRPSRVELACLVDRGHREVPIRPDYVGKNLPTNRQEFVRVRLTEMDYSTDGVYLISENEGKR
ncbi:MAG: bifunctional pyr operon transcriptional regulator/uracil phosphoribosyltransferase PyrR [Deltaproteobacteria bacterium]|nr:bifunctional pyr operon transcriptional regulator/uracil phosphoribosyltransferase PyrR [Deltaproteobacteria bacterium]